MTNPLFMCWLALALLAEPCVGASASEPRTFRTDDFPPKLENLSYPNARSIVLGNGWKPQAGHCASGMASLNIGIGGAPEVPTKSFCRPYPEIKSCNVYMTSCTMHFQKAERCLELVAESDDNNTPLDPVSNLRVYSVSFRKSRCR